MEHTLNKDSGYIRIRFNYVDQQKFKSVLGKASLLDVTIDRNVTVNRCNIQMLDLSSPIMKFFLDRALDQDTGRLYCAVTNVENSPINFMIANILKWQDLQGYVVCKSTPKFQICLLKIQRSLINQYLFA